MLEKLLHVRELHYPVRPSTGGSPAGPILEYAREVGAGLIVVGSHGHPVPVLTGTPRPTRPEE